MSLFTYKLFCKIAEQGNMGRAAELMHISPSAASHAINALEEELGLPLLSRSRKGASLTPYGQQLLPRLRAIVQDEIRLHEEIDLINGLEKGVVNLGVVDSICVRLLPAVLESFRQKYPNIEVQVYQDDYNSTRKMLKDGLLDLDFLPYPPDRIFNGNPVIQDRIMCVAPNDFVPANGAYVSADDLRDKELILPERGLEPYILNFLTANNLTQSSQHNLTLESSVLSLVISGLGFSLMPELVVKNHPGNYKAYPLINEPVRTLCLATLKGRPLSLACKKLIQEIKLVLADGSSL